MVNNDLRNVYFENGACHLFCCNGHKSQSFIENLECEECEMLDNFEHYDKCWVRHHFMKDSFYERYTNVNLSVRLGIVILLANEEEL